MTTSVSRTRRKADLGHREIIAAWGIALSFVVALVAGSMAI